MNTMNMPGFTAEMSLSHNHGNEYRKMNNQLVFDYYNLVIPAYRVVCIINSDNELHCGIEDSRRGISIPLF